MVRDMKTKSAALPAPGVRRIGGTVYFYRAGNPPQRLAPAERRSPDRAGLHDAAIQSLFVMNKQVQR
jgi:hypothetical protein